MNSDAKKKLVWGFVLFLAVAHHDFWFWSDRTLVFGFLPIGLLYQVLISILAAIAWALVVRFSWPGWLEEWASSGSEPEDRHR